MNTPNAPQDTPTETVQYPSDEANPINLVACGPSHLSGKQVHWSLRGEAAAESLADSLRIHGVTLAAPNPPGPDGALAQAFHNLAATHGLLARPGGHGWVLVREAQKRRRGRPPKIVTHTATTNTLQGGNTALPWEGTPILYGYRSQEGISVEGDSTLGDNVPALVDHYRTHITTDGMALWLPKLVRSLDGIGLRPTGGVYFVPRNGVAQWDAAVAAFRDVGDCRFYGIPVMPTEDAARAFLDALEEEAEVFATATFEEAPALQKRARENRRQEVLAWEAKIRRYETLFGEGRLTSMRERLVLLAGAMASIAMGGGGEE